MAENKVTITSTGDQKATGKSVTELNPNPALTDEELDKVSAGGAGGPSAGKAIEIDSWSFGVSSGE
jgi:hypothetical protein